MSGAKAANPKSNCKNCHGALTGQFCQFCGQDSTEPPTKILPLGRLLFSYASGIEGTAPRTVLTLLFRPGNLTKHYIEGRRARYSNPVQVYLWCTAIFFLLHAYSPLITLDVNAGVAESSLSAVSVGGTVSAERLMLLAKRTGSHAKFAAQFDTIVNATLPILLMVIIAASALLLRILFWKETALTHILFAIHWSAFYFILETMRQLALSGLGPLGGPISAFGSIIIIAYVAVAMRVVYQRSWIGSLLRAIVGVILFAVLLGGWLLSTIHLAMWLA